MQAIKKMVATPGALSRLGGEICAITGFLHLTFNGDVERAAALFVAAIYFEVSGRRIEK